MKKTLSLVLALVMVLGSFSAAFAAESVTTGAEAGAFLKAAGVLVGDEHGNLNLGDNLSRQDAVILVAQLRGEIKAAQAFEGTATYEDVEIKFYNAPLAWAQENGLFVGHSEKVFGFNEDLTAQEYAKVLLTALGYKVAPNGDSDIKWAEVLTKAEEFGILKNLKVENATEITRGEMALMTFNALGVNMKGSKKTLAETLGIEMPAPDVLKAEVKDTENLKEVVVELSNAKLADAEKLANKDNYRVDKIKVEKVTVDGNDVILLLEKALVKNRSYDLTVKNIDKAINKNYSFKANDNASPKVEKVEALGEYGIKVTLSEPVTNVKERNFLVDGKNIAMKLETYGRVLILTPYHKTAFSANADKLTIKELEDFSGYKSALEDFVIEIVKDEVAPVVEDVVVKGNVVEVTFDKDVYADSVSGYVNRKDEGNISYRSGRQTIFTIVEDEDDNNFGYKIDTNKVRYVFDADLPRGTEVTIEGVQNHSKVAMDKVTLSVREVKDNLEPEIIEVEKDINVGAGTAKITLEFDKNVRNNFNKNNFALYTEEVLARKELTEGATKDYTLTVDYKQDSKGNDIENIIVVNLGNLTKNNKEKEFDYILEVSNFEDNNRNRMFRDYVEFELKDSKTLEVEDVDITEDKKADKTVVTIEFNYAVDRTRAEDATNYLFRTAAGKKAKDAKELDAEIIVSKNGKTVTIELPEFKYEDYEVAGLFEITEGLRDKDGNKLAKAVVYRFATGTTADQDVAVTNVKDSINALPAPGAITVADKDDIVAAREAYDALTAREKEMVKAELVILEKAEAALKAAEEAAGDAKVRAQILAEAAVVSAEADATKLTDARTAVANAVAAEVDKAITDALTARLDVVQAKAELVAAKAGLQTAIDGAKTLVEDTVIDDAETPAAGTVTTEVNKALADAITVAETAHALSTATVETLNQAKADLATAVATFEAAIAE